MTVHIGSRDFEGPYESTAQLKDQPGVWAIISLFHGRASIVDMGQAEMIKTAVEDAHREHVPESYKDNEGKLVYAACYVPVAEKIE